MANPLFHGIADALLRKRRCPKCGREQIVAQAKRAETVPCKFCGAPVPPPKPAARRG